MPQNLPDKPEFTPALYPKYQFEANLITCQCIEYGGKRVREQERERKRENEKERERERERIAFCIQHALYTYFWLQFHLLNLPVEAIAKYYRLTCKVFNTHSVLFVSKVDTSW